jgi:hypothetical protein
MLLVVGLNKSLRTQEHQIVHYLHKWIFTLKNDIHEFAIDKLSHRFRWLGYKKNIEIIWLCHRDHRRHDNIYITFEIGEPINLCRLKFTIPRTTTESGVFRE